YLVFRTPSPDKRFAEVQRLMETKSQQQITEARNGPIQDYLYHYGNRADPQTKQIQEWADRYDVALREQQLENRHRMKWAPEEEAEALAQRALSSEEAGDWGAAKEQWTAAAKFKGDADPDRRVWGLLGQKRIDDLA